MKARTGAGRKAQPGLAARRGLANAAGRPVLRFSHHGQIANRLREWLFALEPASKIGANLSTSKYQSAHVPLGPHAMDRGAETPAAFSPVQKSIVAESRSVRGSPMARLAK